VTVGKLLVALGVGAAVLTALAILRLAATRNRNAAPILIRYIAPSRLPDLALTVGVTWTSPVIIFKPSDMGVGSFTAS